MAANNKWITEEVMNILTNNSLTITQRREYGLSKAIQMYRINIGHLLGYDSYTNVIVSEMTRRDIRNEVYTYLLSCIPPTIETNLVVRPFFDPNHPMASQTQGERKRKKPFLLTNVKRTQGTIFVPSEDEEEKKEKK
jgi:hypothetical protein